MSGPVRTAAIAPGRPAAGSQPFDVVFCRDSIADGAPAGFIYVYYLSEHYKRNHCRRRPSLCG